MRKPRIKKHALLHPDRVNKFFKFSLLFYGRCLHLRIIEMEISTIFFSLTLLWQNNADATKYLNMKIMEEILLFIEGKNVLILLSSFL